MNGNFERNLRDRTSPGGESHRGWLLAAALIVGTWSSGAIASTPAPTGGTGRAHPELAAAASSTDTIELARNGGGGGGGGKSYTSSAFKPDGVYGGGRGRDPYGSSLDADPYSSHGNRDHIKFAPANQGLHGKMEGEGHAKAKKEDRDEDDVSMPDHRRMNPEDQSEENRANRIAQRSSAAEDEDRDNDNSSKDDQ
jgi:hypothetical protein